MKVRAKEGANGPYVQSERISIYLEHAKQLISSGHAYYCFCDSQVPEETMRIPAVSAITGIAGICRQMR